MAVGGTHQYGFQECISGTNLREQCDELLALQAIFEGSGVERVRVVNSPGEDGDGGPCKLQVIVPVDVPESEVTVKAELIGELLQAEALKPGENESTLKVRFLPPLELELVLPPTYPSQDAPTFFLSCAWLSQERLSRVCQELDRLWKEGENMSILYKWMDWLQNNVFSFLGVDSTIELSTETGGHVDQRACGTKDITVSMNAMKRYNKEQERMDFRRTRHECPVCLEEHPGDQFHVLDQCGHYFCQQCMQDFCHHHTSVGTVEYLKCPDTECNSHIPPHIVQAVLPGQDFERWERLLLQKTLESMTDMDWCPRCNNPVIREVEEYLNLGRCTTCFYSFCTECRDPWHQGEKCTSTEGAFEVLQPVLSSAFTPDFEDRRRQLQEELRARNDTSIEIRKCPNCRKKIEKIGGCNMMVCTCRQKFCWVCGRATKSYNHFRLGQCPMLTFVEFAPRITPENINEVQTMMNEYAPRPRRLRQMSTCPNCRYRNVKDGMNNHVRCGCCSINYCFLCSTRITGVVTAHFSPAACPQHS